MLSKKAEQFKEYLNTKLDEIDMKAFNEIIEDYEERIQMLVDRLDERANIINDILDVIEEESDEASNLMKNILLRYFGV